MKTKQEFQSDHIEALKLEIKQKFAYELSSLGEESYLKRKTEEVLACLDSAIVPVDILRTPDFNTRLDGTENFYGIKLGIHTPNGHLIARKKVIRRSLQMSMQMMNKKDMWKFFLSSTLMELQKRAETDLMLRVGSDHKFATDKESNDTADFVIAGPRTNLDFPLLIADICTDDDSAGMARRGSNNPFNPSKLQNMMHTTLVDFYNSRDHWPFSELIHVCVYGLVIYNDEFYICKMALRPERGNKLAFLYTRGKCALPANIFTKPVTSNTFNQEESAQTRHGDADAEEYFSDEDEWVVCHACQTCHYPGEKHHYLEEEFEALSLEEAPKNPIVPAAAIPKSTNGAKTYRRPNGGSVTAIVSLMQTVLAQHEHMKAKDAKYKHIKNAK